MTLNGQFALKSVSGSATNGLASPAFGQHCSKTCRATQRQKCSPGNVVSGGIRFMQIFAGVRWRGGVKWEWGSKNGDFRFFRSLSSERFTYMATRQLSGDTTVNDLGHISRSLFCFTSNFSKTVYDTAKVTTVQTTNRKSYTSFRLVPPLMTLKYIWRSFQPRLSFPRPFQLSLAWFRVARSPSNSWASCMTLWTAYLLSTESEAVMKHYRILLITAITASSICCI